MSMFKKLMKCAAAATALFASEKAAGDTYAPAVQQFITDTSSYVCLTADDPGSSDTSWTEKKRWNGAAPNSGNDYLVQNNFVLRCPANATSFAGRSLTLDNGRIKCAVTSGTVTFNDLRIYGGRVEPTAANGTQTYAGNIRIYGTDAVPARFSMSSGRNQIVSATLTGDADNMVQVMPTEQDLGSMTSTFGECAFTADNSATYRGRFRVAAGYSEQNHYGKKIALVANNLSNLGVGDSNGNSVLTLRDRAAFMAQNGFQWTNPAYSITLEGDRENAGVIVARNAGADGYGLTLGGGMTIKSATAGAELAFRARANILMDNVQLTNIGTIILDEGTLRLGTSYNHPDVPFEIKDSSILSGTAAQGGSVTFNAGTAFEPGFGDGNSATLTINGGQVNGAIFGRVGIRYNGGNVTADKLNCTANLTRGLGAKITFNLTNFDLPNDWVGSVRLLSAPNLGETDGLSTTDFEITGFPQAWSSVRNNGQFRIVTEGGTKHLEWYAAEGNAVRVRIMPLGDSITYGSQSSLAGYREPLYQMLQNAGYDVDFVGTLQTSAGTPVTDPDHEGHRGWVTARQGNPNRCGEAADGYDGIYENVESWLTQLGTDNSPDIILLHIGTNDLLGDDFAHAKNRLGMIIDRLNVLRPNAWILVGNLLDRTDNQSYNEQIKTLFNPFVPEIVAARRRTGKPVAFVDLNAVVPTTELADGLHPNDAGYEHIAGAWFDAIRTVMPSAASLPENTIGKMVTLNGVNAGGTTSWNTALQWSSGLAPEAGNFYCVPSGSLIRTPTDVYADPFVGEALIFNGGNMNMKGRRDATADANWVLYGCQIAHGQGGAVTNSAGKEIAFNLNMGGVIDVRGTTEAPSCLTGSGSGKSRKTTVIAKLVGEEDSVLKVTRTAGENEGVDSKYGFTCEFAGDSSGYYGSFVADRGGYPHDGGEYAIAFASQAALGAPRTDVAKVTISENAALQGAGIAFTNGYELAVGDAGRLLAIGAADISGLYSSEGIYFGKGGKITGNGSSVLTISENSSNAICFDDVTIAGIEKIVSKWTLRIYPGYDCRELPIECEGTSYDNRGGIYASGDGIGPVTLNANSDLQPGVGSQEPYALGTLGMASLTVNEGARILNTVVIYNGAVTSDFVRVHGNITKNSNKINIVFDRYPHNLATGSAIPILTAANLGTDVTANDFECSCTDTFLNNTIEGNLEIRNVDGEKTLFFVQTSIPIVKLKGKDVSGNDSWQSATNWEDGYAPSSGKNYAIQDGKLLRRSNGNQDNRFAGNSLSIQGGGDFAINGCTAYIDDLRLYSDGIMTTRSDGSSNVLQGNATVYAEKGHPFNFEIEAQGSRTLNLQSNFKGSGDLRFRYYKTSDGSGPVKTYYLVSGDNHEFTGGIELFQRAVCTDFTSENAMGGEADKFRVDRLRFTSNATLRCSSSYVMRDPTRGIYMGDGVVPLDGGRIEVLEGQTLTISNLISGSTSLRATGSGKLALCCDTNAFNGVVRNQMENGGAIVIGAAGAVAKAQLQSAPTVVWQIDAPEGMTVKSLGAVLEYGDGSRVLKVRPKAFNDPGRQSIIEANLVRFNGATLADEEAARALVELDDSMLGNGWRREILVEEVDGALLLKVKASKQGMTIYIR